MHESEILNLTKKLDSFILEYGSMVKVHDSTIKTCKEERGIINNTLFDSKNGVTVKIKAIETTMKGNQSTSTRIISILTAFFMGGMFIMWIIKTIGERV